MDQYSLGDRNKYCTSLSSDDVKIVLSQMYSVISIVRTDGVLVINDARPVGSLE
jgi:hypothetical protein